MKKCQLTTHLAGMPILPMVKVTTEEKVLCMYRQWYETEEPSRVQEEYNPKVHGESAEKKLQSAINSVGEQSALLLMAVRDCIVNKKSQAEIAKRYGIPRSRVQQAMSGKKEHNKGGEQYQQERKRKASEEGSVGSHKSRSEGEKEEGELEKADTRPAPVAESNNDEDDSDELPDIKL